MSFSAGMIGTNKREVREKLYDDVRALLKSPTRFAMLAGGAPSEEIDCIRRRFFRPKIVAFDLAQFCVNAAVSCGVEGVTGNVAFTTVMAGRTFDVFDLDLCRTVKTSERAIRAAAQATTGALAIFASYRDNASEPGTWRQPWNISELEQARQPPFESDVRQLPSSAGCSAVAGLVAPSNARSESPPGRR